MIEKPSDIASARPMVCPYRYKHIIYSIETCYVKLYMSYIQTVIEHVYVGLTPLS